MAAAYNSTTQYSRRYEDLRGVDLTSGQAQVSPRRFAWAQNMWRDYSSEQGGAIETVPGFRHLYDFTFSNQVYGIWPYKGLRGSINLMVHVGNILYTVPHAERDRLKTVSFVGSVARLPGIPTGKSTGFVYNGRFYFLDGNNFIVHWVDEAGINYTEDITDTAYLPLTYVNGEMYEQRNMLLDRTKNRETQAEEFNAQPLYKYERSALRGAFAGFADDARSDTFIWVKPLQATNGNGTVSYGVAGDFVENAFSDADTLKRVIAGSLAEDSLHRTIWHEPFAECKNLEFVALFNMGVHEGSFRDCPALKEIQIGGMSNQYHVSDGAFEGCDNVERIIFSARPSQALKEPFGDLPRLKELAIGSTEFELPAFVVNSGYNPDYIYIERFPYAPRLNRNYVEGQEITAENFPYVLKPNPDYIMPEQPLYDVVHVDGIIPGTEVMDAEYYITVPKGTDWTLPSNYNRLPFLLEEVDVLEPSEDDEGELVETTRYRAAIEYKITGTFGSLESLEKVYIPDGEGFADVRAAFEAVCDAEIITGRTPQPLIKVTEAPTADGTGTTYAIDLIARQAVAYDPASDVVSVEIDGKPVEDYGVTHAFVDGEWLVDKVLVWESTSTDDPLTNHELDITLECVPGKFNTAEGYVDFAAGNTDYKGTSKDAILKCTISATFDDRIFLTGNPALPNTVFYCQRDDTGHPNPTYWGVLNFINDGVAQSPNVAMLPTSDMLMVLKGDDPHDATIYYHTGVDSGNDVIPRIYPSQRGLSGVGCVGRAVNFRDDPVFLSRAGLEAVSKQQVNLERTLAHRSSMVDRMLAREDLTQAAVAEWEGYLMIFTPSGNVYMADSRQTFNNGRGELEYEWYHMADVGYYANQTADYEQVTGDGMLYDETGGHWLSEEAFEAYAVIDGKRYPVAPMPDTPEYAPGGSVWTSYLYKAATGNEVWYTDPELTSQARLPVALFGDRAYIVSETERMSGGTFRPVTAVADVEGVLYMGTADGRLLCFNTDKRDVAVDDEQPPAGTMHRSWYTFAGRQIDSFITTAYDDGGYPDLAKKTVKKSMVLHSKTFPGTRLEVRVRTNRNDEWRTVGSVSVATYDFFSTDYASAPLQLADETLSTIREKEKKWALKQLYVGSVGFRAPWGLYDMGYRFTVTGRIKT